MTSNILKKSFHLLVILPLSIIDRMNIFNMSLVFKIRNALYIIVILLLILFAVYQKIDAHDKQQEVFWPPDMVPHPQLPEQNQPNSGDA